MALEVRTLIDQHKFKSELLKETVRTGDSYCIKSIIAQICSIMDDNSKLFYSIKLAEHLVNQGEVEFVELAKLYIVPALLAYILPINFIEGRRLAAPGLKCSTI